MKISPKTISRVCRKAEWVLNFLAYGTLALIICFTLPTAASAVLIWQLYTYYINVILVLLLVRVAASLTRYLRRRRRLRTEAP